MMIDLNVRRLKQVACRLRLMSYIRCVMPWFQAEEVHFLIAHYLELAAEGRLDRIMFHLPPRTGKSLMASVALPSWWMGKFPSDKIMAVGYKLDLPRRFSRQVMGLMRLSEYEMIFPGVRLAKDAHAVGYWNVEDINAAYLKLQKGEYQAAGTGSGIAGSGFNLGVIDDPMSEQDKDSKVAKDRVWEWWGPGFYTRRQFERNIIVLMMTRWALDDLAGRLQELSRSGGDKWEIVNVPAILNGDLAKRIYLIAKNYPMLNAKKLQAGESLMPGRIPTKEFERTKANMTTRDWNALYMGNPSEEEGAIIKRRYWRLWPHKDLPEFSLIFSMYDTAFEAHEAGNYSARTTWGIFEAKDRDGRSSFNMMLLGRWKQRVDAPDLPKVISATYCGTKNTVKGMNLRPGEADAERRRINVMLGNRETEDVEGRFEDRILIENKASGIWAIKELRRRRDPRIPVQPWTGPRGTDGTEKGKYARAQLATWTFEQDAVWYPDKPWCEDVIDECAKCRFDGSDKSDDLPDTIVAAALYVRQKYLLELESDIDEEEEQEQKRSRTIRVRGYGRMPS